MAAPRSAMARLSDLRILIDQRPCVLLCDRGREDFEDLVQVYAVISV
jgi:hypothetical protein